MASIISYTKAAIDSLLNLRVAKERINHVGHADQAENGFWAVSAPDVTVANGYPFDSTSTAFLDVHVNASNYGYQRFHGISGGNPTIWYRRSSGASGFGTWLQVANAAELNLQTELTELDNLDTIFAPGFYIQSDTAQATTALGYPEDGLNGHLLVQSKGGASPLRVSQMYIQSASVNAPRVFFRGYAGTWGAWGEVARVDSIPTSPVFTAGLMNLIGGLWNPLMPAGEGDATGHPASSANRLGGMPVSIPADVLVSDLALRITTGGGVGSIARVGIYANDPTTGKATGLPLWDSGSFPTESAGILQWNLLSLALPAGTYWILGTISSTTTRFTGWSWRTYAGPAEQPAGSTSSVRYGATGSSSPADALPDVTAMAMSAQDNVANDACVLIWMKATLT